jgi:hypothetical protein
MATTLVDDMQAARGNGPPAAAITGSMNDNFSIGKVIHGSVPDVTLT